MGAYLFRRLQHSFVLLLVIVTFVFIAGRSIGDPARLILGAEADEASIRLLRETLGLDDPLYLQYIRFLADAVRGDFGITYRFAMSRPIAHGGMPPGHAALPLALERLPATFYLASVAIGLALALAIPMGIVAAMRPRSLLDRVINVISLAGVSIVEFWLALMLILVFSVGLGWFYTSGYGGFYHVALPAMALAFRPIGRITQMVRSAMLDELARPYITAARSKGLSRTRIAMVHGLKNAAIPIVTIIGDELANILTGVIIVEYIFAWPGIGQLTLDALSRRDLPMVQAAIFVLVFLVLIVNLTVDIAYTFLNPKVRFR